MVGPLKDDEREMTLKTAIHTYRPHRYKWHLQFYLSHLTMALQEHVPW